MEVSLPGNNGKVNFNYDLLGRCNQISSRTYEQHIPNGGFDPSGNLRFFYIQDLPYRFDYDDLFQITSETGHQTHTYLAMIFISIPTAPLREHFMELPILALTLCTHFMLLWP